jgi:hypothetical protein
MEKGFSGRDGESKMFPSFKKNFFPKYTPGFQVRKNTQGS